MITPFLGSVDPPSFRLAGSLLSYADGIIPVLVSLDLIGSLLPYADWIPILLGWLDPFSPKETVYPLSLDHFPLWLADLYSTRLTASPLSGLTGSQRCWTDPLMLSDWIHFGWILSLSDRIHFVRILSLSDWIPLYGSSHRVIGSILDRSSC